jgi:diguanylate cyclase (GGDEF)-like protein
LPATFQLPFIRSRVARRVCLLFIFCAIVPTTGLAVISFTHVATQLYDQSQVRLRQAGKATGMAIYERLIFLDDELKAVALRTASDSGPSQNGSVSPLDNGLGRYFTTLTRFPHNGDSVRLFGKSFALPQFSSEQWAHVRSGKSLLLRHPDQNAEPRLLLVRIVSFSPSETLWIAEINNDFLWGGKKEDVLPPRMELCVLDGLGTPLVCTTEEVVLPTSEKLQQLDQSGAPYFEWQTTEQMYLGSFWSLPLRHSFLTAPWTVVMSEAKYDALLPIAGFKYTFTLVMGLSLALVSWLSLRQVHGYLIPLARLQEGTRRIAKRDFASRVNVTSGDEFEELAVSFNGMAERLGRQFHMLETMSAISQAILSAYKAHEIVNIVQSRLGDVLACDAIGVMLLESDRAGPVHMSTRYLSGRGQTVQELAMLTDEDLEALVTSPHHIVFNGHSSPEYLQFMVRDGLAALVLLPMLLKEACLGLIVVGRRSPLPPASEEIEHARQLADQVSVALANAREIARRIEADAQAYFLAHYDPLTRLANRKRFHDRIVEALREGPESRASGAIFLIDLNRFQRINDTLGPQTGDRLLGHVAQCLSQCVTTLIFDAPATGAGQPTVARLDGDRFGILLPKLPCGEELAKVAKRILASLTTPYPLEGESVTITASMGIGVLHADGSDVNTLLQNADTALSTAKEQGQNTYQFYAATMNVALANRIKLERALRVALERKELFFTTSRRSTSSLELS